LFVCLFVCLLLFVVVVVCLSFCSDFPGWFSDCFMKSVPVVKMSGSGNDFLMVDNRSLSFNDEDLKALAKAACPRRTSAGADGIIFVEPATLPGHHYRMRIINADGTEAEMCGNGSRCATIFAYNIGAAGLSQRIQTLAGSLNASICDSGSSARVQLSPPSNVVKKEVEVLGQPYGIYFIDTGVPHAVIFVNDVSAVDVATLGRSVRHHEDFKPRGTNVNFVQTLPNNTIKVRTYERGVEGETFACGTGSAASAIVSGLVYDYLSPVNVTTSGGALLTIHFEINKERGDIVSPPFLEGAVDTIYKGEFFWKQT